MATVRYAIVLLCLSVCFPAWAEQDQELKLQAPTSILIKALFSGSALVEVNGQRQLLKNGQSLNGVKLINATSRFAEIEYNGERKQLPLNRRVGADFNAPKVTEIRLARSENGHYFANGLINNRPVRFLVDTGASNIAISSAKAKELRIDYKKGKQVWVATAQGQSPAYEISLKSAAIGNLVVNNPKAFVIEGNSPEVPLLGNSYLSRVDMRVEKGILLLTRKY